MFEVRLLFRIRVLGAIIFPARAAT